MDVILYTDGSARGNPNGPGGYGAVLQFIDAKGQLHEREYSQGYIKTTNNRMELMAAIVGLEALIKPCNVKLYSDSQYLCNAFNQHWIEGWIKKSCCRRRITRYLYLYDDESRQQGVQDRKACAQLSALLAY